MNEFWSDIWIPLTLKVESKSMLGNEPVTSHMYRQKSPFIQIWIVLCCTHKLSHSGLHFAQLHKEKIKISASIFFFFISFCQL